MMGEDIRNPVFASPWCTQDKSSNGDCDVESRCHGNTNPYADPDPAERTKEKVELDKKTAFDEAQGRRYHDCRNVALLVCCQRRNCVQRRAGLLYPHGSMVQDGVEVQVPLMFAGSSVDTS